MQDLDSSGRKLRPSGKPPTPAELRAEGEGDLKRRVERDEGARCSPKVNCRDGDCGLSFRKQGP